MSLHVVDTHAHLSGEAFAADRETVLAAALASDVSWVVNVADSLATAQHAAQWAATATGLYATAGIHPHEAHEWGTEAEAELRVLLGQPRVVAVGEVGLDYHYDFCPRERQQEAFRGQLQLALACDVPVVIHNRAADSDTFALLSAVGAGHRLRGVLHCFWSDLEAARTALEMGLYLGVGGAITFGNAHDLRDVIKQVPLNRLVLETDAPYLAPKPFRGKRNEPKYVVKVAEALAELHQTTVEHVARITSENATALFLAKNSP